jgi:hypothetical protein
MTVLPKLPDGNFEEMYALIAIGADGREGIMGGGLGQVAPMVGRKEVIARVANVAAQAAAQNNCIVKAYRYENRVDVTSEFDLTPPKPNACERATELGMLPAKDLPPLLVEWTAHYTAQHGVNFHVLHAAYSIYAQLVEGAANGEDSKCWARADDRHWFSQRVAA